MHNLYDIEVQTDYKGSTLWTDEEHKITSPNYLALDS